MVWGKKASLDVITLRLALSDQMGAKVLFFEPPLGTSLARHDYLEF